MTIYASAERKKHLIMIEFTLVLFFYYDTFFDRYILDNSFELYLRAILKFGKTYKIFCKLLTLIDTSCTI